MMQLKAIFSVLLREWEFELAQPHESYRNDHSKMVVQLAQPCRVRYRRRQTPHELAGRSSGAEPGAAGRGRVRVDLDLCQGHGVCASEAPQVFRVDAASQKVRVLQEEPPEALQRQVQAAVEHCPTRALLIDRPPIEQQD